MLNLIHKRRMDSLKLQIKNNGNIKRKMVNFWSGIEGEDNQDPEAVAQDNSNELQTQNDVINQFEKNVFDLFKSNQISAQRFITSVPESDYPDFNNIFPELKSIYFGQGNQLNSVLILERAKRLIQNANKDQPVSFYIKSPIPNKPVKKKSSYKTPSFKNTVVKKQLPPKKESKKEKLKKLFDESPIKINPGKRSISTEHSFPDSEGKVICLSCSSVVKLTSFPSHLQTEKHLKSLISLDLFNTPVKTLSPIGNKNPLFNDKAGDY